MASLDIAAGDILVIGTQEYPIRAVEQWYMGGYSVTFARVMSTTASTKRAPAISGGKRGAAVANLSSLKVTPLMPINAEIQQRLNLATPFTTYQVFCQGTAAGDNTMRLIIEDVQ